jgi:hypothetical protein
MPPVPLLLPVRAAGMLPARLHRPTGSSQRGLTLTAWGGESKQAARPAGNAQRT